MGKNGETNNIDTVIIETAPLISHMIAHHGGECECVAFIRTSSQGALEDILGQTHQRKNADTEEADTIIKRAKIQQQKKYTELVKSNDEARMTRHKLPHTKNRITTQQVARQPLNYVKKTLGDDTLSPTVVSTSSKSTFQTLMATLPIQPSKISDNALTNLGLTPRDFDTYCGKAKEIHKDAVWKKIAYILAQGKPVFRSKGKSRSSRIMQIQTGDGDIRYALFVNRDNLHTHTTPSRTSDHRIENTSFEIFENYDKLLRSQEHALNHLSTTIEEYVEWQKVLQDCRLGDESDFRELISEAMEYFSQKQGFYPKKIYRYLRRAQHSPAQFLSHALRNLNDAINSTKAKREEISQVYQNLANGREKIIMEEVQKTAQLINR